MNMPEIAVSWQRTLSDLSRIRVKWLHGHDSGNSIRLLTNPNYDHLEHLVISGSFARLRSFACSWMYHLVGTSIFPLENYRCVRHLQSNGPNSRLCLATWLHVVSGELRLNLFQFKWGKIFEKRKNLSKLQNLWNNVKKWTSFKLDLHPSH